MDITVEATVNADLGSVWKCWNNPEDIKQWNTASEEWHTTQSEVDLREGGRFSSRMEAKDGSMGFDFEGTYTKVIDNELLQYEMDDGRKVTVAFEQNGAGIKVTETFEAEKENDPEMQRKGWQAILDNFSQYVENQP